MEFPGVIVYIVNYFILRNSIILINPQLDSVDDVTILANNVNHKYSLQPESSDKDRNAFINIFMSKKFHYIISISSVRAFLLLTRSSVYF